MTKIDEFTSRLNAEFDLMSKAIAQRQAVLEHQYHERQSRFEQAFLPALEKIRAIWEPRRDALIERFKDIIHVQPDVRDHFSEVSFSFDSALARVTLRFKFFHDPDVRNVILDYDLEILPILMKFDNHSALEMPLDKFDEQVVLDWIEGRVISFTRTFVKLNENQYYLNDQMVVDPVAGVRMPRMVARETLDWEGHTYYFISAETRHEFEKLHSESVLLAQKVC